MNIVISSVGRRAYLVEYFRQALMGRGLVIGTNSVADATGMVAADRSYVIPLASDERFIDELIGVCVTHKARLLFSLHDWEVPFIAANRERFREVGTIPLVPGPDVTDQCLDKLKTCEFARRNGIPHPYTVSNRELAVNALRSGDLRFPIIIKPRFGQGSIGIETLENEDDFQVLSRRLMNRIKTMCSNGLLASVGQDSLLFQEVIVGKEYGLDVVNDFEGRYAGCMVKQKIAMRSGETDIGETLRDPALEELGKKIGVALGHVGIMGVDIKVRDEIPYLIEMNPRFTGHYPFAHMAGANVPAAYVAWAEGKRPNPEWLQVRPGVRCYKEIRLMRAST